MSRQIGLDCIACRPTPRPGHTEFSMEYHSTLIREAAGADPDRAAASPTDDRPLIYGMTEATVRRFFDAWDYDFLWRVHDGFVDWSKAGRVTDLGHAAYAADGSDQRAAAACPFQTPEEVWTFDPVREYGLTPFDELKAGYQRECDERRQAFPEQITSGGYYRTTISGALQSFGWDMLLVAAADEAKFARVLERFGAYTLHHARAWAETSIDVYIQHDDIVWTSGPFMNPAFYRSAIFPIYRELWKPLKAAGKKVLFCSDGTFDMFMEDIAACGADGFIFEPSNDFEKVVRTFGGSHVIAGSKVDCRTLALGTWEQVKAEIDATLKLTRGMPGFMFSVGNHIPANVTDDLCRRYIDYLRSRWGAP